MKKYNKQLLVAIVVIALTATLFILPFNSLAETEAQPTTLFDFEGSSNWDGVYAGVSNTQDFLNHYILETENALAGERSLKIVANDQGKAGTDPGFVFRKNGAEFWGGGAMDISGYDELWIRVKTSANGSMTFYWILHDNAAEYISKLNADYKLVDMNGAVTTVNAAKRAEYQCGDKLYVPANFDGYVALPLTTAGFEPYPSGAVTETAFKASLEHIARFRIDVVSMTASTTVYVDDVRGVKNVDVTTTTTEATTTTTEATTTTTEATTTTTVATRPATIKGDKTVLCDFEGEPEAYTHYFAGVMNYADFTDHFKLETNNAVEGAHSLKIEADAEGKPGTDLGFVFRKDGAEFWNNPMDISGYEELWVRVKTPANSSVEFMWVLHDNVGEYASKLNVEYKLIDKNGTFVNVDAAKREEYQCGDKLYVPANFDGYVALPLNTTAFEPYLSSAENTEAAFKASLKHIGRFRVDIKNMSANATVYFDDLCGVKNVKNVEGGSPSTGEGGSPSTGVPSAVLPMAMVLVSAAAVAYVSKKKLVK